MTNGLTYEQLVVACKNIGFDLNCPDCAILFYTGYTGPTDRHDYIPTGSGHSPNCTTINLQSSADRHVGCRCEDECSGPSTCLCLCHGERNDSSLPTAEVIANEVAHLEEKYAINRAVAARGEAAMQSSVEAYKIQNLEKEIQRLKVGWRDAAHIAEARIQELGVLKQTAENERNAYRKRKDEAYEERNRLVALFASIAVTLGWPAGIGQHVDVEGEDWDPEWRTLVVVQTPEGQASWHFHDSQRYLVEHLPDYAPKWDGHNTKEKYERLMRLTRNAT